MFAAQHLVSAVADEVAGADTVSWEMHACSASGSGDESIAVDLATTSLTPAQIEVFLS